MNMREDLKLLAKEQPSWTPIYDYFNELSKVIKYLEGRPGLYKYKHVQKLLEINKQFKNK